jgi:membrane fusion protein (multidrug efflux system)
LLRRHFFLVFALGFVLLLAVLGGFKLLMGKGGHGGPGAANAATASGKAGKASAANGRAPAVAVATAAVRAFTDRIDAIGVAKAHQSVTLTSQTTEIATKILFTSGQVVHKGQVLAQLKADEQQAAVVNAEAALKKAESDNLRWQELSRRGFAPKSQVDQFQAAFDQAKANLTAAQSRLHDRVIRAPFSGTIGLSDAAPGMLITPGTPIATLDDVSVVYVDFDVPERYIGAIGPGTAIQATADALAGQTVSGRVQRIDTRVKPDTRSITARAEIPNPGGRIKPGMLLKVSVEQGVRNAVAVPEAAVQFETDRPFVYVIAQQGGHAIAQQKTVVAGVRQAGFVEIRAGLSAGDRVVGDGLNRIQPNQPVKVTEALATAAARPAAP